MMAFRRFGSQPRTLLYLLFELGDERYALDTRCVLCVLPFVDVERVMQAPLGLAGTVDHRNKLVPVIDLCVLALGRTAERRFSTRIVVMNHVVCGQPVVLGAVVERATRTTPSEPADATFMRDAGTLLARVHAGRRLTEAIAHARFPVALAAAGA